MLESRLQPIVREIADTRARSREELEGERMLGISATNSQRPSCDVRDKLGGHSITVLCYSLVNS